MVWLSSHLVAYSHVWPRYCHTKFTPMPRLVPGLSPHWKEHTLPNQNHDTTPEPRYCQATLINKSTLPTSGRTSKWWFQKMNVARSSLDTHPCITPEIWWRFYCLAVADLECAIPTLATVGSVGEYPQRSVTMGSLSLSWLLFTFCQVWSMKLSEAFWSYKSHEIIGLADGFRQSSAGINVAYLVRTPEQVEAPPPWGHCCVLGNPRGRAVCADIQGNLDVNTNWARVTAW